MKRLLPILFLSILILTTGCEKDQPSDSNEPEEGVLVTANIGAEGGSISTENFSLTVPSGAFSETTELKLSIAPEEEPYGENEVSSVFRVDGLPDEIQRPLRMAIKYEGSLSDESYIAIGENVFIKSLGKDTISYCLFAATDSAGYLVFDLIIPDDYYSKSGSLQKGTGKIYKWIYSVGVSNLHSHTTAEGHFEVIGPKSVISKAQLEQIGTKCESAYGIYKEKGFSYEARENWPIVVFLKEIKSKPGFITLGFYTGSKFLGSHGYIVINKEILNSTEKLSTTIGHEFLHLIQDLYDPRAWEIKLYDFGPRYWLDEATAVFSEEYFADNPAEYVSGTFLGYVRAPFHGVHMEGKDAGTHGYGMASLIKYLNNRFLSATIKNLYSDIYIEKHPIEALIFNTNETTDWLAPFFRDYIEGKIYNIKPGDWIDNIIKDYTYTIEASDDTLKNFNFLYPDLSAELFKIELKNTELGGSSDMIFTITGNEDKETEVAVYKYDSHKDLVFIDKSITEVNVPNIKDLTTNGWNLLSLVTNSKASPPYTNKSAINLKIKVEKELEITNCNIFVRDVDAKFIWDYGNGNTSETEGTHSAGFPTFYQDETVVTFSDNTLTQTCDYNNPNDGNYYVTTYTLKFDKDMKNVTSFSAYAKIIGSSTTREWSISGQNVPVKQDPDYLIFEIKGQDVCNHIESMTSYEDYKTYTYSLQPGWTCNEDSELEIYVITK